MDEVARLPEEDRRDLFRETAAGRGLPDALVEKDFWVCWLLKQLFTIDQFENRLMFKGGTALSKIHGLIERFSEDIDLAVDWAFLGFEGDRDPNAEMSNSKRRLLLDEMGTACTDYIATDFLSVLKERVANRLGSDGGWRLRIETDAPHVVWFDYPATLELSSYLKPAVQLEMGTHAAFRPSGRYSMTPFAAQDYGGLFLEPSCEVCAIAPERTFWEKATILHQEFHRPADKVLPKGYARHYYDVVMLARSEVADRALAASDLLADVVLHKQRFWPRGWARYDLAVPSTLAVLPAERWMQELERDYRDMSVMFYGDAPSFDELLEGLRVLETQIRAMTAEER